MQRFLDVRRVVETLVERERKRLDALNVVVDVEDGLHCHESVSEGTVADVFGAVLDHLLLRSAGSDSRLRIGWLPTSSGGRVFFLTNSGYRSERAGDLPGSLDDAGSPERALLAAQRRVEQDGGQLWSEGEAEEGQTVFVLFGSGTS